MIRRARSLTSLFRRPRTGPTRGLPLLTRGRHDAASSSSFRRNRIDRLAEIDRARIRIRDRLLPGLRLQPDRQRQWCVPGVRGGDLGYERDSVLIMITEERQLLNRQTPRRLRRGIPVRSPGSGGCLDGVCCRVPGHRRKRRQATHQRAKRPWCPESPAPPGDAARRSSLLCADHCHLVAFQSSLV